MEYCGAWVAADHHTNPLSSDLFWDCKGLKGPYLRLLQDLRHPNSSQRLQIVFDKYKLPISVSII